VRESFARSSRLFHCVGTAVMKVAAVFFEGPAVRLWREGQGAYDFIQSRSVNSINATARCCHIKGVGPCTGSACHDR
jgi:hypothetical protein